MVDTDCSGCHNGRMRSPSNVLLDEFDATQIAANPDIWSRAYRQLQAGTMPLVGAPRPDGATCAAPLIFIEKALDSKTPAVATSQEIATRLAKLLWNSIPDAALLQERLTDPVAVERQIHRMLGDDRSQSLVSHFFFPWLQLDKFGQPEADPKLFPDYYASLRDSQAKKTELFLLSQLRDDRDPVERWSADCTFLNEQLAKHYGIPNVSGAKFRRVNLSAPERAGLLGQGSVLMATSSLSMPHTTPATRGKWIRFHFLGVPPPNPFPGATPVKL